ncbi:serine-threonine protein kinase, putative [Entamoeba invadens IP1]|uniref:Serine-threonine protein kinase, putative n=1 Tax=Entamoeba invadens IP1 TaxID=370355 RepID=A0A0A1UFB6_ENTIV|nr:serine-threonine protein kinase, putative [Entamoeba invadens IP1]ELP95178.1 serine-threonine protein kinase, putative [Entamoeba invadens IP1]|eukprot:XP_004261949.1 serine-threonine protein kinase, putative [Entamoeba invadens IP1]
MFLLLLLIYTQTTLSSINDTVECTPGCSTECLVTHTCQDKCNSGFEQDNSCSRCAQYDETAAISDTNQLYTPVDDECKLIDPSLIQQKTFLVPDDVIVVNKNEEIVLNFVSTTKYDTGPCRSKDNNTHDSYRRSFWMTYPFTQLNLDTQNVNFSISFVGSVKEEVRIDTTDFRKSIGERCFTRNILRATKNTTSFILPLPRYPTSWEEEKSLSFFVYVSSVSNVSVKIRIDEIGKYEIPETIVIPQSFYEVIAKKKYYSLNLNLYDLGYSFYPPCMPDKLVKGIYIRFLFDSDYTMLIDSTSDNRIKYMEEVETTNTSKCKTLWVGQGYGKNSNVLKGLYIAIPKGKTMGRRFGIYTEEQDITIPFANTLLCKDNCHYEEGFGKCSSREKKCICNEKYGGESCIKKCYYQGEWTDGSTGEGKCYFGSDGCNENCYCHENYTLNDHLCISPNCLSGSIDTATNCYSTKEGCNVNCLCEDGFTLVNGSCKSNTCGNNQIDVKPNGREEECDGGINCDNYCNCYNGFKQDLTNKTSCIAIGVSDKTLGLSIGFGTLGLLLLLVVIVVLICVLFFKTKRTDLSVYKEQQPTYHFYISGATKIEEDTKVAFKLGPDELDFGNKETSTSIFDTRFERIQVVNNSKKKMLIIFHTPTNPKFVFHFDPQYLIIHSRNIKHVVTCFMTIFCTTKLQGMKIPYTVWFSKSRKTLEQIEQTLRDKTFEEWTSTDQLGMEQLLKKVSSRMYGFIKINTTATASTHIDMDELNLREQPIAEGAMGVVFFGEYRSMPVAVKQFRWENLTDEETIDLKRSVVHECEMMSKLRNPFIANYIGSVTYLPQVCMVIQFFALGSLGEYLRKGSDEYLELPYHLKLRILFDTARGMQFLHENKIMHLDLKPDNLLVNSLFNSSPCCVKITDFGTSRFKLNGKDKGLGTPIYSAPECYSDCYSFASDVYAFGVTAWEVYYQEEPFKELKSLFDIKKHVTSGLRLRFETCINEGMSGLINHCWCQSPEERYSFEKISSKLVALIDENEKNSSSENVDESAIEAFVQKRNERLKKLMGDD